MKVLLIGEYSRLHNSLKEGLTKLGHDVLLVGNNDDYKNYPVDLNISSTFFKIPLFNFINKALYKITSIDLIQLEIAIKFLKILPQLKDFDIVQLINENSIKTYPNFEVWFLKKIRKQNNKLYLLSCGTDYTSVNHAHQKKFKYSILTPLHKNPKLKKTYKYILKYITPSYYKLHQFLFKHIDGVIASDIDYHIPLKGKAKYKGLIPNPINIEKLAYTPLKILDKIIIFHGISSLNYIKKGNCFFEDALQYIQDKYPEKIEVINSRDLPYSLYIQAYNSCHIFLDQVYAYDQGYNALEAMAKGKVVFTGAEQEWLEYYELEEDTVAINALPDTHKIIKKLESLILNPEKIIEISKNTRAFIEKEHHYITIAKAYVNTWNSASLNTH